MKKYIILLVLSLTMTLSGAMAQGSHRHNPSLVDTSAITAVSDSSVLEAVSDTTDTASVATASPDSDYEWSDDTALEALRKALGPAAGAIAIVVTIFCFLLVIVMLVLPIILLILLFRWLKKEHERGVEEQMRYAAMRQQAAEMKLKQSQSAGAASQTAGNAGEDTAQGAQAQPENGQRPYVNSETYSRYSDEWLWRRGIRNLAIGLGIALLFLCMGAKAITGVGLLIACYGGGQMVMARTSANKKNDIDSWF